MSCVFTRLHVVLAVFALGAVPSVRAAEPAVRPTVKLSALSKEQLQKLGENDPIEFNGKMTTKAALLAPLRTARADTEAELKAKMAQSLGRIGTLQTRSATLHRQQIERSKALVSAELAKLRIAPTPAPKPTPCGAPVVAGMIGLLTPDSEVLVLGHCFRAQQGSVALQTTAGNFPLIVVQWGDGAIVVHVPSTLSGVTDQLGFEGAQLLITTTGGQSPPQAPRMDFHATRDHRVLEASEVKTLCSPQADINNCDPTAGRTLDGSHSNTVDITSDNGADTLTGDLKNGWVIVDQEITWAQKGNPLSSCKGAYDAIPTTPTGHFTMHYGFSVAPFQYCRMMVLLYAEGPAGTKPH